MVTINFDWLNITPGTKILDIGCGPGRHTASAFKYKNAVVIGADLDHTDLLKAKNRMQFHQFAGEYDGGIWGLTVADITKLPFPDNYFDVVICSEVMEHIPDDKKAVSELLRVLKPGKNLVVSVPRFFPEWVCWRLSDEYYKINQGHIRIYRSKQIKNRLEAAGAKLWGHHFAHGLHSPYWWLKCLLGPTRDDLLIIKLYKKFLDWDTLSQPKITKLFEKLLNPVMGKSVVFYLIKE